MCAWQTRTTGYTRVWDIYLGGVSIPCRPITLVGNNRVNGTVWRQNKYN